MSYTGTFSKGLEITSIGKDQKEMLKYLVTFVKKLIDLMTHAFVETLEDVMTDYFGLELYYKNDSPYNSFYYGALAVNDEGDYILDCEATIRISTHDPHRTSESEKEKAKQKAKLNEIVKGKRLQPVRKNIVINDKEFSNYEDAYEFAFSQIERAASVLNRKKD